jgi:2-oxoglutarate ferredoxin oxidoreductase subunit gamma
VEVNKLSRRSEIIIAGAGGQGQIVAAVILGEAAISEGMNVVQTQTYGIAQRGGFSSAEVIISSGEILYHQVVAPDLIIALNECVVSRFADTRARVLYDSSLMSCDGRPNWQGLPFAKMAGEIGDIRVANLVAIGAMTAMLPIVHFNSLTGAIRAKFSAAVADRNIAAVTSGIKAAEKLLKRN